jgi:hydrogenase maturation protease
MGVGNPLMRDEGIGPRVVELLLSGYDLPENIEVVDAGTMGYYILDMLRGIDRLILIDAIKDTEHPPGTVLLLSPEDLAENQVMHSLHDLRIVDVLQAAALMDRAPETICVAMQIESIEEWILELSEPCQASVPIAAAAVLDQLEELGFAPVVKEGGEDVVAGIIEALRSYEPMPRDDSQLDERAATR